MVWLVFSGYVVGAVASASLLLLPEFRHRVSTHAQRVARAFARQSRGVSARVQGTASVTGSATVLTLTDARLALRPFLGLLARLRRHRAGAGGACAQSAALGHRLVDRPACVAEPFDHIEALLRGEQLTAPPPLPPEVFTTRKVERVRPELASANRDWSQLDPDFRQRLITVLRVMKQHHAYEVVLIEG